MARTKYFNQNLKYLRQQKNISQQELADKMKIDRSTISRWENNEMDATLSNALQISEILNVAIEYLISKDLSKEDNISYINIFDTNEDSNKHILEKIFKDENILINNEKLDSESYIKIISFLKNNKSLFFKTDDK